MRTSTMPEVAPLFLRAALPVALALLAGGCKPSTDSHGGSFPPPAVTVITVEPKDVPVTYEYVAQTAGFREVEVRARVTGIVLKRNYREGAQVRQGESLFTIDPAPFQTALARNEADLAVAGARLAPTKRDEGARQAGVGAEGGGREGKRRANARL